MVNLLPEKNRRSLTLLYYARLGSVVMLLAALAVWASAALLTPSYFLANGEADAATRSLEASKKNVDRGSAGGASGIFAVLSERVKILKTYTRPPETAQVLALVTAHTPKGVSITKFTLTAGDAGAGTISLTGKSDTRSSLLAFVSALQGVPAFQGVSVPVSALASDTNLSFTLAFSFNLPHP